MVTSRTKKPPKDPPLKCSFCGKTAEQVKQLITTLKVFICDECVDVCHKLLEEEHLKQVVWDTLVKLNRQIEASKT